jgi:hypothetical protein
MDAMSLDAVKCCKCARLKRKRKDSISNAKIAPDKNNLELIESDMKA